MVQSQKTLPAARKIEVTKGTTSGELGISNETVRSCQDSSHLRGNSTQDIGIQVAGRFLD